MKIIIFGSTGMLGRYVLNELNEITDYNVICINRDDFDIEKDQWSKLDKIIANIVDVNIDVNIDVKVEASIRLCTIKSPTKSAFISPQLHKGIGTDCYHALDKCEGVKVDDIDIIINCAGTIPQKSNNTEYKKFIRVNSIFPHKLNEYSQKYNLKLIHITTDCVFDGKIGNYLLSDLHSATDIYGISKSQGEPEEATIIRTSIIGEENYGKKSLIEWIKSNKNGKINGFINHYWNGITCLTLAQIIKKIIDEKMYWKGVRHIFSPNTITKYELCNYINEIYNLDINIEKYDDSISKKMTLSGEIYFPIEDIYEQIKKQKNYNYGKK
jgi:dTDP-4-dehydrorhamnose reductase